MNYAHKLLINVQNDPQPIERSDSLKVIKIKIKLTLADDFQNTWKTNVEGLDPIGAEREPVAINGWGEL